MYLGLIFGFIFLYAPIITVIIYSFNGSRLVNNWESFSFKWYETLFQDEAIINSVIASLKIAVSSATIALCLGTTAAIAMVRFKRFYGRQFLNSLLISPLMMPDIIMGFALLLLFVWLQKTIGWPSQRGLLTVSIAHATVALSYVYLVVQARLMDFDRTIEEAALDLGCKPVQVFFKITFPIIAPALVAGWMLALALSLDDLVIASFLAGPGATTLPMVVFSSVRLGLDPKLNALASIIVVIVSLMVITAGFFIHRQHKLK